MVLSEKEIPQFKNGGKLKKFLTKEYIQMIKKYIEKRSPPNVVRGMQIKTVRHHYTPIRMVRMQNSDITRCW